MSEMVERATEAEIEAAARALVSYALGAFENQERRGEGRGWLHPPLTPNAHCWRAAQAALEAAATVRERQTLMLPSDTVELPTGKDFATDPR